MIKNLKYGITSLVLILSTLYFILAITRSSIPFNSDKQILLTTTIVIWLTISFTLIINKLKLYSFPAIFLYGTYAFGPVSFLLVYLYGNNGFHPQWSVKDYNIYLVSTSHYVLAYLSFFLGSVIYSNKGNQNKTSLKKVNKSLRFIGFALFIYSMTIIAFSILSGQGLAIMFLSSYGDLAVQAREGTISPWILTAYNWFLPWSVVILLVTSPTIKTIRNTIILFMVPTILILFLFGDRAAPFYLLGITLGIIYLKFKSSFNISLGKLTILAIFSFILIPTIRETRKLPISQWNFQFFEKIYFGNNKLNNSNIFTDAFLETSFQAQCLPGTLLLIPEKESYRYGYDFLKGIYYAVPLLSKLLPPATLGFTGKGPGINSKPTAWFTYYYNKNGTAGIAFSQIAEAYMHFGVLGIFFFYFIFGYYLTSKWKQFENNTEFRLSDLLFFLFIFMTLMLWIRNDSGSLFRNIFYGYLFAHIFPIIINLLFKINTIKSPIK